MILSEEKTKFLEGLKKRVSEIEMLLSFEEVLVDAKFTSTLKKELAEISPFVQKYEKLKKFDFEKTKERNGEYENLISEILNGLSSQNKKTQTAIIVLNPQNGLSNDLKQAYKKICKIENLNYAEESCGIKVSGENAFRLFENENGLHKSEGEDVLVIVFPEPEIAEEFKIEDVKFDIFHSSGAGGQNVNKVSTAVRAIHTKLNISVVCQDERTQAQNKKKALENLKIRYEKATKKKRETDIIKLKKRYKSDEVIRVYNYKTNMVKDINSNLQFSLDDFFNKEFVNVLKTNTTRS